MNGRRRIWAVVLAAALVLSIAPVFATLSPTQVTFMTYLSSMPGVILPGSEALARGETLSCANGDFVIYEANPSVPYLQDVDVITKLVNADKKAPIDFFSLEKQAEIVDLKLLPENTDLQTLQMNEFIPIGVCNYKAEYGDITVGIEFPTFAALSNEDKPIVAMAAVYTLVDAAANVWNAEWYPLSAKVSNGLVYVTFLGEYLEKLQGNFGSLMILNQ